VWKDAVGGPGCEHVTSVIEARVFWHCVLERRRKHLRAFPAQAHDPAQPSPFPASASLTSVCPFASFAAESDVSHSSTVKTELKDSRRLLEALR